MTLEPDLHRNGWELESAEERHRADPDRFIIPSQYERASLVVGSRVKLFFLIPGRDDNGDYIQCERMWVTVIEVNDGYYVGTLESRPATSAVLAPWCSHHLRPRAYCNNNDSWG